MSEMYDSIMKGLHEALEFEKGNKKGSKVHKITIKEIRTYTPEEIKEIRLKANMTQNVFASCIGVTKKAVEAWECGRTSPDGAARRTIGLLADNPHFAFDVGICIN